MSTCVGALVTYDASIFQAHRGGKLETRSTVALASREDLSIAYTPGVARVCEAIAADPSLPDTYTWVSHAVAVVTDGSAVVRVGNIGPRPGPAVIVRADELFEPLG